MIRLIIVDDEEITRSSLLELIAWDELGIDEVQTAKNGIDALEKAQDFTPSILLCDVRMPKMDGIELSRNIRKLYPDCEIIFLSGYSDKEYLKTAIQVNAIDYLEKPVEMDELKSAVKHTVQKIQLKQRKGTEDQRLKKSFQDSIHIIRQDIILELISGKSDLLTLLNRYVPEVLPFALEGAYTALTVIFNWVGEIRVDDKSSIKNGILKNLNNGEVFPGKNFLAGFIDDNYLLFIINDEITRNKLEYTPLLKKLTDFINEHSNGTFTISAGISYPVMEASLLNSACTASIDILKQQFYLGTGKVYFPSLMPTSNYNDNKLNYPKFKKLLRNNSLDEAIHHIKSITDEISVTFDPDINKIKNIYFKYLLSFLETTMQWDITDINSNCENKYIWQEVDSQVTLKGLCELIVLNINSAIKKTEDEEVSVKKIKDIIRYLKDNYQNNQLTIQSVAESASLSQTYLCAFFKKSVGKTINEFITELRIEKAKELILDNKKLLEITACIGLSDVNYMSTLFKKFTGMTPSEFREKNLYDKKNY